MAVRDTKFIGVTIPNYLYDFIQEEINDALFISPADWIRSACREYYEKRKRERVGGGAIINCLFSIKKKFSCVF